MRKRPEIVRPMRLPTNWPKRPSSFTPRLLQFSVPTWSIMSPGRDTWPERWPPLWRSSPPLRPPGWRGLRRLAAKRTPSSGNSIGGASMSKDGDAVSVEPGRPARTSTSDTTRNGATGHGPKARRKIGQVLDTASTWPRGPCRSLTVSSAARGEIARH